MAIFKKLGEIQAAIKGMTKDGRSGKNDKSGKNDFGYEYVTGNKILGAIRPMMDEKHLLLIPSVESVQTQVITYEQYNFTYKQNVLKTEVLYVVNMQMTWVDTEDGETHADKWAGSGQNAYDKGFGSALTYGERYYLLKLFHIPTDKDDVDYIAGERDAALAAGYDEQARLRAERLYAQPVKKELTDELYNKFVVSHAKGETTKSGGSLRDHLVKYFNITDERLKEFDEAVTEYKINNNL